MARATVSVIEVLEGRTLFSGTPSPTVAADIAAVSNDKITIAQDRVAESALLKGDRTAVTVDARGISAAVRAEELALRTEVATEKSTLIADEKNGPALLAADSAALKGAEAQLKTDKSEGNQVAAADDAVTVTADEGKLNTDQAAVKAAVLNDKANLLATERSESGAIKAAALSATQTLTAAKQKLSSDQLAENNLIAAEQRQLASDQAKLVSDERNHV